MDQDWTTSLRSHRYKRFYGATMREVDPGKGMYQPGCLRKVCLISLIININGNLQTKQLFTMIIRYYTLHTGHHTIKLRELLITIGTATRSIGDWHLSGLSMNTDLNKTWQIHPFRAVVDRSVKIINTGDKLAYRADKVPLNTKQPLVV